MEPDLVIPGLQGHGGRWAELYGNLQRPPMSRKMFTDGRHTCTVHSVHESPSHSGHGEGIGAEGPITNDLTDTGLDVQDWSEAEINADRTKLCRHEPAGAFDQILIPFLGQDAGRGKASKALAKTLDSAAFVIDGDQEFWSNGSNFGDEGRDLFDRFIILRNRIMPPAAGC